MAPEWSFEQATTTIARMKKSELKKRIQSFKGRFQLDFTDDYLNDASADRLRHILLAAMINTHMRHN